MIPPETIDVRDHCNGFTAITTARGDTLWRPGAVLTKYGYVGKLISYKENSFWQLNNDVTMAQYKIKGYRYIVACWFDNQTGARIA